MSEYIDDEDGGKWIVESSLAYRGKKGCTNMYCSTKGDADRCYGWHCTKCDEPCSMMGHECQ